jgi:hypothetical protein
MGSAACTPPGITKNNIPMNAATRAEQTNCSFFIVSLLSLLSGLGVMFPADVAAPKL